MLYCHSRTRPKTIERGGRCWTPLWRAACQSRLGWRTRNALGRLEACAPGACRGSARCRLAWIKTQEDAGIDIVSDGEQFRKHFVHGFLESVEGIDWQRMTTMGIRDNRYDAQVPTVTAAVRRKGIRARRPARAFAVTTPAAG